MNDYNRYKEESGDDDPFEVYNLMLSDDEEEYWDEMSHWRFKSSGWDNWEETEFELFEKYG